MTGGIGAADTMKKSYENNRNLLGKKKHLKELMEEQVVNHNSNKYTFKKADPKSISELHNRLVLENRASLKRTIGILVFLAMIIFGAMYFFVF